MKHIKNISFTGTTGKLLIEIERFVGSWNSTKNLKPSFINELKQSTIITSSGASTRIEGALLTDDQISKLIKNGCKITSFSSRSEREVTGYIKTLNYIYENYQVLEISELTVRQLHQLLTSDLLESQLPKNQRGSYKNVPNDVVEKNIKTGKKSIWFRTTPPGPQTNTAMYELIKEFNQHLKSQHIPNIILVGVFIVHFLAIHPFRDGNGRLSRLLTIWLMLKLDYVWFQYVSHEKIIEDNKQAYYVCLRNTQSTFSNKKINYKPWINFFLLTLHQQVQILASKINQMNQDGRPDLNSNETKVFKLIKSNPHCSISFIEKEIQMSRAGLKSLLSRLVEKEVIQREGEKKGAKYYID